MMIVINAPYRMVRDNIRRIKGLDVGVEVYFNNDSIGDVDEAHVVETGKILQGEGIRCTVHAPFMDLSPGAVDRDVRNITKEKLKRTVTLANSLGALGVVCHPGYDKWRFGDFLDIWLEGSADTWNEVLAAAGDKLPILLENVFEEEPRSFIELFTYMRPKNLYFCFDSGHFNLFTKVSLDVWLSTLGNYVREMHLHDNHGTRDDHLPIGQGIFPFRELKGFLKARGDEIILTAEVHEESYAAEGIKNLKEYVA